MSATARKEMGYDITLLRRSETEDIFLARRDDVESNYSRNANITKGVSCPAKSFQVPRWFYYLYYAHFDKLVLACNFSGHGIQFQFQGSSYTESGNSVFREAIVESGVRFYDITEKMPRVTQLPLNDLRNAFAKQTYSLQRSLESLILHGKIALLANCTPYALHIFVNSVVTELGNWQPNQVIAEALQDATGEPLVSVKVESARPSSRIVRISQEGSPALPKLRFDCLCPFAD